MRRREGQRRFFIITTLPPFNSTQPGSGDACGRGQRRQAAVRRTACGLRRLPEGRKEGRQAGRLSSTYAYAPTNSYCGAAPRKVVRRCSQFERIKESRAREEEGRGNRGAGGGVVLISPLLGASTKRIRPMERATCSSLNIDSSRRRLPRSPCHDKLLQG